MKRKFLAKAITLGLMLAVPLSAYAKDADGNAEGIIVNNEDKQTVVNGSDLSIDINNPLTSYTQINGKLTTAVGLGLMTRSSSDNLNVDAKSLTITNSITNDFTQAFDEKKGTTEISGLYDVKGIVTTNALDINLNGINISTELRTVPTDPPKDVTAYVGVFGIRMTDNGIDKNDEDLKNKQAEITVNGKTNIDIFGKSARSYLYGISVAEGKITLNDIANININGENTEATKIGDTKLRGISIGSNGILKDKDVNVKLNGAEDHMGIYLGKNAQVDINGILDITSNVAKSQATGIMLEGECIFKANDVNINLNDSENQIGLSSASSSNSTIYNNLNINLNGAKNRAIGLQLANGNNTFKNLHIKIADVEQVQNKNKIVGIRVYKNKVTIDGDVNIDVGNEYAIRTEYITNEGSSAEKVVNGLFNDFTLGNNNSTVKIKGDIAGSINTNKSWDKSIILNLNNAQSSLEGTTTGKVDLNLKEKSIWTNTGASTVNNLTLNGANLVQGNDTATITKANGGNFTISGNNTIALNTTSNGSTMDAGENAGGKNLFADGAFTNGVAEKTTIKLTSANQNAADISKDKAGESFDNLLKALGDSNLKSKVTSAHLDATYITGAIDATADENGSFTGEKATVNQQGITETIEAIKKLPSINLISWRTENNELSKRLGEVRDYDGEEGIWARMNHGESKYLDSFKTKSHLYQMGYDKKVGEWRLGGAVSYNKGTTTYENGNGKNRSTSLALYGAWLGDKGHYADIIVKEGKQKSELTIGQAGLAASNLDYDLWATSISAEYGRKIALKSDWFVEPQAELTYGRLGSADYGDNGFSVHQDSMDSLVGRMGFRLGKNLSDTSNIYMKASVLHEFCGDVDYSFTEGTTSKVSSADLGDTWYEVGVGGSAQIGKATYAYAGIEKTFGGDFSTPWQWNAGVRWSF